MKLNSKLDTVNVVETINNDVISVRSFKDNHEGHIDAEIVFEKIINKHGMNKIPESEMDEYIRESMYDDNFGYRVVIIHSVSYLKC